MSAFPDFATITLTDARGRFCCEFSKETPESNWTVSDHQVHPNVFARDYPVRKGHQGPHRLKQLPDGRWRLDLPDRSWLPWEKLPPVLDRLVAEFGNTLRLTVSQLRVAADSST